MQEKYIVSPSKKSTQNRTKNKQKQTDPSPPPPPPLKKQKKIEKERETHTKNAQQTTTQSIYLIHFSVNKSQMQLFKRYCANSGHYNKM